MLGLQENPHRLLKCKSAWSEAIAMRKFLPRFLDLVLRRSDDVFCSEAVLLLQFLQRR
jgi:hypothetical protein